MYSGTTLRVKSGRVVGVHQRIDRLSHRYTRRTIGQERFFPMVREILYFEGKNGPDGIKQKQPARDEPWHYINPDDPDDLNLLAMIRDHQHNLVEALREQNSTRAAFEAAWLSHTITDGLTPAHHYPFQNKLEELRGESIDTRTSFMKKNLMPGDSVRGMLQNNWEYWGAKGVMTTHFLFEYGIAMTITGRKFESAMPDDDALARLLDRPIDQVFKDSLRKIDSLQMYQAFARRGWTRELTHQTNHILMPTIIRTVMVAWAQAAQMAGESA